MAMAHEPNGGPGSTVAAIPPILRLPVEVQLDIIASLPLPERLIWTRELCSPLRRLSDMLGRRLICPPSSVRTRNRSGPATTVNARLSLPALYHATHVVHPKTPEPLPSSGHRPATPPADHDTLPNPPPESVQNAWYVLSPRRQKERAVAHAAAAASAAASRVRVAVDYAGLGAGPGSDVCLFLRAVRMLLDRQFAPLQARLVEVGMARPESGLPTSLYLVGWHGIPGDLLREMLIHEPILRQVRTIVKTDQHDADEVWNSFPSS